MKKSLPTYLNCLRPYYSFQNRQCQCLYDPKKTLLCKSRLISIGAKNLFYRLA